MISYWQGKTAIVTGAGTGIGKAVSIELASRGARVYVTALTQEEADVVVAEIVAAGNEAIGAKVDVCEDGDIAAIIQRVVQEQGKLDLMFNNAGVLFVGEYLDMDEEFITGMLNINVRAVYIGTLYAYRTMKAQGHGVIANVASHGGLMPVGTMAAYSGTKHAVIGLSASVGGEAAAHGVEIKAVCPGNVQSEMLNNAKTRGTSAAKVLGVLPAALATEKAARIIVDGLASKKHKIIFPFSSRVLTFIQRMWPEFGHRGAVHSIEQFRSTRTSDNQH